MQTAKEFWENKYGESAQIWSGKVNQTLAATVSDLTAGTALDLGCGEGGDAIWLARRGWAVTGVDLSETALARATGEAARIGLEIDFVAADLEQWRPETTYDLVVASFLHSPVEFARDSILDRAVAAVKPGGWLFILGHAAPSPMMKLDPDHPRPEFLRADEQLRRLNLAPDQWTVELAEDRARGVHDATGAPFIIEDAVVFARRTSSVIDLE